MPGDSEQLGQDEIEALLASQGGGGGSSADDEPQTAAAGPAADPSGNFSLGQDEIEALMAGGGGPSATATESSPSPAPGPTQPAAARAGDGPSDDVELLLDQAQAAIASIENHDDELPEGVQPFRLQSFGGTPANGESATLELVRDVQLDLKIELGRTRMPLESILRLRRDAVVTLDKLAGDPVDVYVNGRLIARGEVLVLNDNFCVRVTELLVGDSAVA